MSAFTNTAGQMLVLFLLLLAGFAARRCKLMDDRFDTMLSTLVMNVTMPALVLDSVLGSKSLPGTATIVELFCCSVAAYALLIAAGELLVRTLYRNADGRERGAHCFAIVFGNVGFMGFPVVAALFGSQAVLYAAIFNIPMNALAFTWGVASLKRGGGPALYDEETSASPQTRGKRVRGMLRSVATPCVLASVLAAVLACLGIIDNEGVIGGACSLLGQFTTPASLLVIGSSLGKMRLMSVINRLRPYLTVALRLLAAPLAVHVLFGLFVSDPLVLGVMTVCSGMPVASMGTMLSLVHGGDLDTIVRVTSISTLLSLVTIPLIALLVL